MDQSPDLKDNLVTDSSRFLESRDPKQSTYYSVATDQQKPHYLTMVAHIGTQQCSI